MANQWLLLPAESILLRILPCRTRLLAGSKTIELQDTAEKKYFSLREKGAKLHAHCVEATRRAAVPSARPCKGITELEQAFKNLRCRIPPKGSAFLS